MKTKLNLTGKTPKKWLKAVMSDFDNFLLEACDSQRKNASMALMFVAKYPQYSKVVGGWLEIAQNELKQFREIYREVESRDLKLGREISKDLYINRVVMHCRNGRKERFVDRMIVAGLILLRGAERYRMVAAEIDDKNLQEVFNTIANEDTEMANRYIDMVAKYYDKEEVADRMKVLQAGEAEVMRGLETRAALH